ncbi:MAG TPA: hypothetical protein VK780_03520 [Thermoanaerobaculia bacterium]|nr:hypothetical protein [Thermoanaerobaculia bacterium]
MPSSRQAVLAGLLALFASGCGRQNVSSDGYQARLARGVGDSVRVAARGSRTRLTETMEGQLFATVRRPDLGKTWFWRPLGPPSDKVVESPLRTLSYEEYWTRSPPSTDFDIQRYSRLFQGSARVRDRLVFEQHPCEIWEVTHFDGRVERIWRATDLGGLPVRIQRGILIPSPTRDDAKELMITQEVQLLEITPGAPAELFEPPPGKTTASGE